MSAIDKNYIYDKLIKSKGEENIITNFYLSWDSLTPMFYKNISKEELIKSIANAKLYLEAYMRTQKIYPSEVEDELMYQLAKLNNKLEREQDD